MKKIFRSRTKDLEVDIDSYLDKVDRAGLLFHEGISFYIEKQNNLFKKNVKDIKILETEADTIRRSIIQKLYKYMLIPDARGDVLGLLENMDNVIDVAEKVIEELSIEKPRIYEFVKKDFLSLAKYSTKAVEELTKGARAFFKEINLVNNYINQVHFYEHEADNIEEMIKRKVFESKKINEFSLKVQLRYFAEKIALPSDEAEKVSERLAVYAIKRTI